MKSVTMTLPKTRQRSKHNTLRVFISHCIDDKKFVFEVCDHLSPYLGADNFFLFEKRPSLEKPFLTIIDRELSRSTLILIFVGKRVDDYMSYEVKRASTLESKLICIINISGQIELPSAIKDHLSGFHIIKDSFTSRVPADTVGCAKKILETLEQSRKRSHQAFFSGKSLVWRDQNWRYGLPASPNVFDYEKSMILFYVANRCHQLLNQGLPREEADDIRQRYARLLELWPEEEIRKTFKKGVPAEWPSVWRYEPKEENPFQKDTFREECVRVNALVGLDVPRKPFVFLEAGPRPKVALPKHKNLKVAIVVTGGIAPGINAVIDAIVQRHYAYLSASEQQSAQAYNLEIVGLKNGLLAIEKGRGFADHIRRLTPNDTVEHATRGGSMLGTSRDEALLDSNASIRSERIEVIARELKNQEIDVLYIIGGDGSMKAAHALWHKVNSTSEDSSEPTRMSVVAIPKTMDNDILWVWQSFGFLSAVQEAREIVERLHTEVRSNPRLGIVQFFGSGSGFVVSHAVLAAATGHTTLALIPELDFSVIGVARYVKQRLWEAARPANTDSTDPAVPIDPSIPHGLIVMAETAIPLDALECLGLKDPPLKLKAFYDAVSKIVHPTPDEKNAIEDFFNHGRRVQGQTSDALRSLGIKLLHELLPILIKHPQLNEVLHRKLGWNEPNWKKLRMVRNEPRYLVRALEPSTSDIITGQRLGLLAVDAAMAGYTDCMISQWLTEFAIVPLDLVVLGRKRIPPTGMFWNSVTAKTRQPSDLVYPYQAP
jgi:6-phosphofructokinase